MKKIILIFLVAILLVTFVVPTFAANDYSIDLDKTTVVEDLSKVYKNMSDFYLSKSDTDIYLITMAEAGVTEKGLTSDYALYFYFHNPSQKEVTSSDFNKLQLACEWDVNGDPINYAKYELEHISTSNDLSLLKYKLTAPVSAVYMSGNTRRYDISGVEFVGASTDSFKSADYSIGRTYVFSGYEGDLLCTCYDLLTITLKVHQTSYLSGDSGKEISSNDNGAYSNQINSVYFSIPNSIVKKYGGLYAVDYEFYHYRTKPMLVVDNENAYNTLLADVGQKLGSGNYGYRLYDIVYTDYFEDSTAFYYGYVFGDRLVFDGVYNYNFFPNIGTYQDYFTTVFYTDNVSDRENILVSADEIQQYFEDYDASSFNGEITTVGSKKYSADLWDLEKSVGYQRFYRTIDDTFSLDSYADSKNNNFLKHLFNGQWHYLFDIDEYDNSLVNVPFIEEIKDTSFSLSTSTTSENLYISSDDVSDLKKYFTNAKANGERTYLLRYAYSDDYYSLGLTTAGELVGCDVLLAQENVYLDFDIITLSFRDKDVITVVPVVADPIDGFTGIENTTPDPNFSIIDIPEFDWIKLLFGIIAGAAVLYVAFYLFNNKDKIFKEKPKCKSRKKNGYKRSRNTYNHNRYKRRK